ncbi:MAG: 50S ribosomal protein L23 [Candidatus Saccharimonadales bacterium]
MINVFPRKTEKAYAMSLKNIYVFDVPTTANSAEIIASIEAQYGVKIAGIRTLIQSGKAIRYSRGKKAYPGKTNRKDAKKAYVTLVKGDSIKIFEEAEAETKTTKKEKK